MSYDYQREKKELFTEEGQVYFLNIRDQVKHLLKTAGAFRHDALNEVGSSWTTLACLDRLVELKEIVKLRSKESCWAQYQVYTTPETDGR